MQSRIEPAVLEFMKQGFAASKIQVAEHCHCHTRTAHIHLRDLYKEKKLRIYGWIRECGAPLAVYIWNDGLPDAARPKPISKDVEERNRIRANRRTVTRMKQKKITLGLWGV